MFVSVDQMRRAGLMVCFAVLLIAFGAAQPTQGGTDIGGLINPQGNEGDPLDSNDYSDPGSGVGDSDDDLYLPPSQTQRPGLRVMPFFGERRFILFFGDTGLGMPVIRIFVVSEPAVTPEARHAR